MMSARLAILAVLCCALAANATVTELPIGSTQWSVSYKSVVYNINDDTTSFNYAVTTGAEPLGHFVITSTCSKPLADGSDFVDHTSTADASTGKKGYVYPIGQDAHSTVDYSLVFKGDVAIAPAGYAVKEGQHFAADAPTAFYGPACSGSHASGASLPYADQNKTCAEMKTFPLPTTDVQQIDQVGKGCPGNYEVIITYSKAPVVGTSFFTTKRASIFVKDEVAPTIDIGAAHYIELKCDEAIPPLPTGVTATDDCDPNPLLAAPCVEITNGSCPANTYILRSWTATDHCGNTKCVTQTIAQIDNEAPIITGVPNSQTIECTTDRSDPPLPVVSASDRCGCFKDNIPFTYKQVRKPGECANTYDLITTYTSTDCCGNTATASFTVTVTDNTAPEIHYSDPNWVPGKTYDCDKVPARPDVYVTDVCTDASSPITPVANTTRIDGSCPSAYQLLWEWTATDECGNVGTKSETINVRDPIPPQWVPSSLPASTTVECGSVPAVGNPDANDNCFKPTITYLGEHKTPGLCPNEYTLNRTWSASDSCGNTIYHTQIITVIDTTPTKIDPLSVPQLGPFKCFSEVPSLVSTNPSITSLPDPTGCDDHATLTSTETPVLGTCVNKQTIYRYYTLTDCSGNTDTVNTTIVVNDDVKPTLIGVPGDITVECDSVPTKATVHTADNCDCPVTPGNPHPDCITPGYTETRINGSCPHSYTLKRTWTVTDVCGNTDSATQTITVQKLSKPTITNIPGPVTVQCDQVPARPPVNGQTNCGTFTITTPADTITPGSCSGQYTIVRHWHIEDECGNFNDYTQTITVIDTTKPQLSGVPSDTTVSCANVPIPADVCGSDNCDGVTITFNQVRTDKACDASGVFYTLVRTWTATDACGNTYSQSQTIKVTDTINPQFNGTPQNLVQACDAVQVPPAPTAQDSCTAVVVSDHSVRGDGSCQDSYTLYQSYKATDFCGNFVWYNFTITVSDNAKPTISNVPIDKTDNCAATPSAAPTASDTCDPNPTVSGPVDTNTSYTCPYIYTVRRTWTATDRCGNADSASQIINVVDPGNPVFQQNIIAIRSAQCEPNPPPTVTAKDACFNDATVNMVPVRTNGSCVYDYTLVRTWTATDVCNKQSTLTETWRIKDTTLPTLGGVPADTTALCSPPLPAKVCGSDNCVGVALAFKEEVVNTTCTHGYTLKRTWTATDLCGNTKSESQFITVYDNVKPQFTTPNPGPQTATCFNGVISAPVATDNCGASPTITNHTWVEAGDCPYHYTVHVAFKATDACGNSDWWNYTIAVGDSAAPQISWTPSPPQDGSFTCDQPPAAPVPSVIDNCGGATVTGPVETISSKSCEYVYTLTRVWTISDACGNGYTVTQTLNGVNNGNPSFDNAPGDTSKRCQDPLITNPVSATDSCGKSATVTGPVDTNTTGSCADQYDIVRVWTATDRCQLTSSHTQTVHVYDNEAPAIVVPNQRTSVNNECTVDAVGTPTVTDNCDPAPAWTANQTEKDRTCAYRFTKVNHYYANDRCGNPSSATQDVVYSWNAVPQLFNTPPSVTVECDSVPAPATVTAKDGCNVSLTPAYNQVRTNGSCPNSYTLDRTWSVSDACQVPNSYTQTITVRDTTVPTLCNVPSDITVQCGFVPDPATVTANDNCDGVTITYTETKLAGQNCCDYKLKRKWVATDACGNQAEATQTITVIDRIPPQLEGVPPDVSCAECPYTIPNANVTAHKPALAYGYCVDQSFAASSCYGGNAASASTVTIDGVVYSYEPASTFVTWYNGMAQFEIHLKNPAGTAFLAQIVLDQATNFTALPANVVPQKDLNANCYPGQADPSVWTYYLSANGTMSGGATSYAFKSSALKTQLGLGASGRTTEWGVTVFADYEASAGGLQTAAFHLSLTKDGEGSCYFNHTELPHFECNDPIPVVLNTTHTPGSCAGKETITREWCATDESGNKACAIQVITVCDTTAPEISGVPAQISVSCDATIPVAPASATDACDSNPALWYNDSKTDGSCPGSYQIVRTYTTVDECGNNDHAIEYINVFDHTAPTLDVPAPVQAQCDNVPPFGTTNSTDNCGLVLGPNNPSHSDVQSAGPQNCPQSYVSTRTWTVTDQCGNPTTKSSTITVRDDNQPTITNVPNSQSLQCKLPAPTGSPTANDACAGDITSRIVSSSSTQNTNCPNLFTVTITYNVQDFCGNAAAPQQWSYTYIDTVNPFWNQNMPANTTVQCDQIPAVPTITAGDACNSADVVYSTWQVGPANGDCAHSYVIYRKWVATDCAGNSISHTQAITVIDTTAPVITPGTVADVTATCKAVPNPPDFCVTDNCDGVSAVWSDVRTNSNGQPNACDQYVRNRTLIATDDCGNTASVSYTVTVNDQTAPICSRTPDFSVSCEADTGAAPPQPTCTDDCSTVHIQLLAPEESQGPQACPQSKYRLWAYKITDDCGNVAWSNTTVTIYDNTQPILANVPSGDTFQCGTPEPADPVTASDNCDTPSIVKQDTRTTVVCAGVYDLTRTWYAIDACGNQSPTATAVYHFIDNTKPQFNQPMPANTTVQCHQVPAVAVVSGTDNCDANPAITYRNWTVAGSCDNQYTIYREWTITDCSGNSDSWLQEIQVIDTTFPTSTDAPASSTVQCHTVPEPDPLCADDNCVGVTLDYHQTRTALPGSLATCNDQFVLNRSWVATDACGNHVDKWYTITVNDVVPPTCAPSSITPASYSCENRANTAPSRPSCTEDCSNVNYESFPVHVPGSCAYNYVDYFNFKATDDCGNVAWVNTSVTIYDTTNPHFITVPSDATVQCSAIPAREDPTWGDNCGTVTLKSYTELPAVAPTGCQNYVITRTWVIEDECGNTESHTQTLTVQDTTKPQWVLPLPTDKTFQCDETWPEPTLSATDNCGTPNTVRTVQTVPGSCNNQFDKVYTWVSTDACGNNDTYSVTYHIIDTSKPTITQPVARLDVSCDNVPAPPELCCSDTCDGVHMFYKQTRESGSCDSQYILHRNWTCVDNCGNFASVFQDVYVTDTTKPQFNQPFPQHETYECTHTGEQVNMTATDNCGTPVVTQSEVRYQGDCGGNYTIVRSWQAMDGCGNVENWSQNITVHDTIPPFTNHTDVQCYVVDNFGKDILIINDLTVPNHFFPAGDLCKLGHIEYVSCTSDQDGDVGPGCSYDANTDTLTLSTLVDIFNLLGRLYTVTADIYDECGHSIRTSRDVFIPLNATSGYLRNITGFDDRQCIYLPPNCDDQCGCQTVNHYCKEGERDYGEVAADPILTNDGTSTTFTYTYNPTSGLVPNRLILGVDLSKVQLINAPFANTFGRQFGSVVSGIAYTPDTASASAQTFSFVVAGVYSASDLQAIPYALDENQNRNDAPATPCSFVRTVKGPVAKKGTAAVQGTVAISGVRYGNDRTLGYPVKEAIVALLENGVIKARTATDVNGQYSFSYVPNLAIARVQVLSEGSLVLPPSASDARTPGQFIRASVNVVFGQPILGWPQWAASDPNFNLLIDDSINPVYARTHQDPAAFEGNSKPVSYWAYQLNGVGRKDFSAAQFTALATKAAGTLSCPALASSNLANDGSLASNVIAAAYNVAAGRGVFDPYKPVQEWYLAFASHVACSSAASVTSADRALALHFASLINAAADFDRHSSV